MKSHFNIQHSGYGFLLIAYVVFIFGSTHQLPPLVHPADLPGSVVLPAPLQTVIYMGDPFLAANVEAARVLATGGPAAGIAQDYFDRLHRTVAVLNACHEDNYYVANALLAWAGSVDSAIAVLQGATDCRFWDEMAPFYLGYNLNFFRHEHLKAKEALFQAAARSADNSAAFMRMGILYEADTYPDLHLAQKFLVAQRDQARDPVLKQLLDQRIGRLAGLIILRDAQAVYEKRVGGFLKDPNLLISIGILKQFPTDPVRMGYVFENGQFALREIKMRAMEGTKQ